MLSLLNNKFFVIFLAPFILGAITIIGFPPYNLTFINFFSFSILLFLISIIKKKTQTRYKKKNKNVIFFTLAVHLVSDFFYLVIIGFLYL